mmetsp:Transcript_72276/g.197926  ORF Transcript_72276/g.197926 Transcript_72276/m.197926 type:complete len:206 (+) Transcript_72276:105-722(+)
MKQRLNGSLAWSHLTVRRMIGNSQKVCQHCRIAEKMLWSTTLRPRCIAIRCFVIRSASGTNGGAAFLRFSSVMMSVANASASRSARAWSRASSARTICMYPGWLVSPKPSIVATGCRLARGSVDDGGANGISVALIFCHVVCRSVSRLAIALSSIWPAVRVQVPIIRSCSNSSLSHTSNMSCAFMSPLARRCSGIGAVFHVHSRV